MSVLARYCDEVLFRILNTVVEMIDKASLHQIVHIEATLAQEILVEQLVRQFKGPVKNPGHHPSFCRI